MHHYSDYMCPANPACKQMYLKLTHWGRVTHICVGNLTIIGSDNGLSPGRRQAIIWTNAGILLIGPLGTNFNEIFIEIPTFSFMKMRLNVSSVKWRPFCLGLNVLIMSRHTSSPVSNEYYQQSQWCPTSRVEHLVEVSPWQQKRIQYFTWINELHYNNTSTSEFIRHSYISWYVVEGAR